MNQSLDSAQLKLVRAEEHINALEREMREYLDTQPYEFIEKPDRDKRVPAVHVVVPPPPQLRTIIGDCLYNLRASLDLTFWALASRTGSKDPDRDRVFFPIFSNESKFQAAHNGLAKHISTAALGILEEVQPFRTRNPALSILRTLSNLDRNGCLVLTCEMTIVHQPTAVVVAFDDPTVPIASVDIVLSKILRHISADILPKFEPVCS